ncbi:hypothetical protein EYM_04875 [Ignicoccus islandicus DSM 13165]|uniref:Uncharacterized protein n=1 Tax=Ignicoccus islandicus DSM 13165 TaxID=940295 RepID=A0A0U3FQC3_9CREN|nr:hypothetical protein EYM_04875 [Ignicoccus islandicus DSM 13165]
MEDGKWLASLLMWIYYLSMWIIVIYLIYRVYVWATQVI